MKERIFLIFSMVLSHFCYAQQNISVYVSSVKFNEEYRVYQIENKNVVSGAIFFLDTIAGELYKSNIIDGISQLPCSIEGKNCKIALFYDGRYFCTTECKIDSLAVATPVWTFRIEESDYGKELLGHFYFALSIPPFEYGATWFNDRKVFNKKSEMQVQRAMKSGMLSNCRWIDRKKHDAGISAN
jgi:hypothetical protein